MATIDFGDLLQMPGRVFQEPCEDLDYRRRGSKRELAQGILERSKKNRTRDYVDSGPRYSDASKRPRGEDTVDPQGGEPP